MQETHLIGLTPEEALKRLEQYGHNMLPKAKITPLFLLFLHQFKSPLIYILLIAAIVSVFLDEVTDAIFIAAVIIINAIIGTVQEFSAQKSASSLQQMVPAFATVLRGGKTLAINTEEIVPGDVVLLKSGDKVPADIKLTSSHNLAIDESLLTGESVASEKNFNATPPENPMISEQENMAFAGTIVSTGRGHGEVTATALNTEIGKIAEAVTKDILVKPPLLLRIEKFTLKIMYAVLVFVTIFFAIALQRGDDISHIFMISVALAVSAIPEGLPVAITVALSIGMRRMAERNVIVRKLLAVESLGSCTFIASDKTGTLTVNELTVKKIALPDGTNIDISGEGLSPNGTIKTDDQTKHRLARLIRSSTLANEAMIMETEDALESEGDMVDVALLVMAHKYGIKRTKLLEDYKEIATIPYESENGFSAAIHEHNGENIVYVKGAPEKILDRCTLMETIDGDIPLHKQKLQTQLEELACNGYRVLAIAQTTTNSLNNIESQINDLTFLGFVAMIDPLRSEAKEAVDLCKQAGIEVAMITGDHPLTARAISLDLGLIDKNDSVVTGQMIKEAQAQSPEAVDRLIADARVFARIEPTQKKEIVQALSKAGHFVAVTGDGANDAPALKHAHVGVAMGKRGTDVARESADLILTNDDFSSIVHGIHEGRIVYSNIRKVIFLLVSTGAAEITLFTLSMAAGLPLPLTAVQLLWLNLVTNGVQDVALAFEPAEGDELKREPRSPKEPIFDKIMLSRISVSAVFMGVIAFSVYAWLLKHDYSLTAAQNYILLLMVLLENVQALNSRSESRSIFRIKFFSNPLLIGSIILAQTIHISCMYIPGIRDVLQLNPVSVMEWGILCILACSMLSLDEIFRLFRRKNTHH